MVNDPVFERVASAVADLPVMDRDQGSIVFQHLQKTGAANVLELGTAHGTSAAYMAAALEVNGGGRVTTVDMTRADYRPAPAEVLNRAGVADRVDVVRTPDSSYTWWLGDQVAARSDDEGNCAPQYDFCYIDGPHNFTIDGLAVILVERLLNPGGWVLLDDLRWSYAKGRSSKFDKSTLSEAEIQQPHVARVFDLIVKPHPGFTRLRRDGNWGWAQKGSGEARRLEIADSRPVSERVVGRVRGAARRLRSRA